MAGAGGTGGSGGTAGSGGAGGIGGVGGAGGVGGMEDPSAKLEAFEYNTLGEDQLAPLFDPDKPDYELLLPLDADMADLLLITEESAATIDLSLDDVSVPLTDGQATINVSRGLSTLEAQVTSSIGGIGNYTVDIERAAAHQQAYLKASNTGQRDWFGTHVAIDEDTIVVGASLEDSNGNESDDSVDDSGAAYVFTRLDDVWAQTAYLKAPIAEEAARFGSSVAIDGDVIVVGAPYANGVTNDIGAAYVFERSDGQWSPPQVVASPNESGDFPGDNFGYSVAASGGRVFIGAPNERFDGGASGGFVHVYERGPGGWEIAQSLQGLNTDGGDDFGASVAADGDQLIVGARGRDVNNLPNTGAAYIFAYNQVTDQWEETQSVTASNAAVLDFFGHSVAIDANILAVSAPSESSDATGIGGDENNNNAPMSGAVYIFERSNGSWSQKAYVKASNSEVNDQFGGRSVLSVGLNYVASISLSGNTLLVGASGEDSGATGIDGDQGNSPGSSNAGAAYLFERIGDQWVQTSYIKASNTDGDDQFGASVALDGTHAVVGAWGERSATIDPTNNAGLQNGAGYVFLLTP